MRSNTEITPTLTMVRKEAARRAMEDGCLRVVYKQGGELLIRLINEDKTGAQVTLCIANPCGRVINIGDTK